jgi:predicted nucleic acid-binding protein
VNIFLDANILVSVLNREYPIYTNAARITSLGVTAQSRFKLFTSPLCLGIAFYFAEKKYGRALAKSKISLTVQHINVAPIDHSIVSKALKNKHVEDFEDGVEYYSAIDVGCKCIVTEDTGDFFFSSIEVLTSEAFMEKYLMKGRVWLLSSATIQLNDLTKPLTSA